MLSLSPIKKNTLMYYVKGGLHRRKFIKINTTFKHMLYIQHLFVYTEREFSKTNTFYLLFFLFSYSCRGKLIQKRLKRKNEKKRKLF